MMSFLDSFTMRSKKIYIDLIVHGPIGLYSGFVWFIAGSHGVEIHWDEKDIEHQKTLERPER